MIQIGKLAADDRTRWAELWRAYLAFYETELPERIYADTWDRLLAGREVHALAAREGGTILGITHYLFHASCWTPKPICYLQDLFTDSAHRGRGVARALIGAVGDAARAADSARLYWLTQNHNATARALYDKVAKNSGFIRYDYPAG